MFGSVDPASPRGAGRSRASVFIGLLALAVGLAVVADTFSGGAAPLTRTSPVGGNTPTPPTPIDSTTTANDQVETALPSIGGLALGGQRIYTSLTRSDPGASNGAWTVVVRRNDGSFARHGAVVTYPVQANGSTDAGSPVRVGSVFGISGRGFIIWPLGDGYGRVRGDLPQVDLVRIAELSTVVAGRPQVRPPAGFRVVASAPSRLRLIHEMWYNSGHLGLLSALGDGLTYTALTIGGGFEDAVYAAGATAAGVVHGAPAVASTVEGGNGTLAWETSPGMVAYVGWSGSAMNAEAVAVLRTLANGTSMLTPRQWLATKPELNEQVNNPAEPGNNGFG